MRALHSVKAVAIVAVLVTLALVGCSSAPAPSPTTAPAAPKPAVATTSAPSAPAAPAPAATSAPAVATTSAPAAAATKPATAPAAQTPTGELRIAVASFSTETLYPPQGSSLGNKIQAAPLFDIMFGGYGGASEPGIVEKWQIAPDGLSWTFNIRKGVKFHNGDSLTADDVKFTMESYVAKDATDAHLRNALDRVEKVDDYTLRAYTKKVLPFFPDIMSYATPAQGFVLPKNYIAKNGIDYFKKNPVGSGSWKFVRAVPGDRIEYEAVENHWRQTPAFKKLVVLQMPEEATRVAALKTDAVDIIDVGLDPSVDLEKTGFKAIAVSSIQPDVFFYGAYDKRGASMPIADIKVRQALSFAINRQEILKGLFYSKTDPLIAPFLANVSSDVDVAYWQNWAAKTYRYDPAEAKRLLAAAGQPNGFSLKFYVSPIPGAPFLAQVAQVIQRDWSQVGVKAELVNLDYGTFQQWRNGPDERLVGAAFMARVTSLPTTIAQLTTGYSNKTKAYDLLGATATEMDKLIDAANAEIDAAKRKAIVAELVQKSSELYVSLPLEAVPSMIAVGPKADLVMPPGSLFPPLVASSIKQGKR